MVGVAVGGWIDVAVAVAVLVLVGAGTGVEVFGGCGVFVAVFGTLDEVGVRVGGWVVAVATGVRVAVANGVLVALGLGSESGPGSVAGAAVSSGCGGVSEPIVLVAGAASAVAVGGITTGEGVGVVSGGGM